MTFGNAVINPGAKHPGGSFNLVPLTVRADDLYPKATPGIKRLLGVITAAANNALASEDYTVIQPYSWSLAIGGSTNVTGFSEDDDGCLVPALTDPSALWTIKPNLQVMCNYEGTFATPVFAFRYMLQVYGLTDTFNASAFPGLGGGVAI